MKLKFSIHFYAESKVMSRFFCQDGQVFLIYFLIWQERFAKVLCGLTIPGQP